MLYLQINQPPASFEATLILNGWRAEGGRLANHNPWKWKVCFFSVIIFSTEYAHRFCGVFPHAPMLETNSLVCDSLADRYVDVQREE